MVEWATDQAVHGNLTVSRPADSWTDPWVRIGSVPLSRGATLTADNTTCTGNSSDGTLDAAFDAVAFVPVSQPLKGICWEY